MERTPKDKANDLAAFGGIPSFTAPKHVGRPNIGDRERLMARFNEILDRRWFTNNGNCVQEFERMLCAATGAKHCIPICNGTVALEIVIRALGLKGEVIVPSFTFVATAHALQWQEITPVFCDIDAETLCIDPGRVEELITPRTAGIIGMHAFGRPCDVEALASIAAHRGLPVIYDAAHAFYCSHKGTMVGRFGRAEVLSFHATKFVNTFEGGAVITDDDELAKRVRLMKNFGFAGVDRVIYVGTNGKMNEFSAAMGITSLETIDSIVEINQRNLYRYVAAISDVSGVTVHSVGDSGRRNFQYIVLRVDENKAGLSRDHLVEVLTAENVFARRYFYPGCHRMEPYRSLFPHAGLLLPVTERVSRELITVPTGTSVSPEDIGIICDIVRTAVVNSRDVRARVKVPGPATHDTW